MQRFARQCWLPRCPWLTPSKWKVGCIRVVWARARQRNVKRRTTESSASVREIGRAPHRRPEDGHRSLTPLESVNCGWSTLGRGWRSRLLRDVPVRRGARARSGVFEHRATKGRDDDHSLGVIWQTPGDPRETAVEMQQEERCLPGRELADRLEKPVQRWDNLLRRRVRDHWLALHC